ncbi:MAG TPA: YigZ family protein [Moheibacter sp.]|nr:YigZ family protein [Moheibacter sp.]
MNFSYQTIANPVEEISFKEKGSKFIGYAFPVLDEDEIKENLIQLWQKYPDATHICYAFRLGIGGERYRANDDGEPSGSAGLPIYNQIISKEITNVLVCSVRFYGGTKLGVAGLVKAYKLSAQMVLDDAEIVEKHLTQKVRFEFSYENQGSVMRNIDKFNAEVLQTEFTENCVVLVRAKMENLESFLSSFEPLYQVKVQVLE